MSIQKILIWVLVALLVFPVAYSFFSADGRLFFLPANPTIWSVLKVPSFWLWASPTYFISAFLISRTDELSGGWKIFWIVATFFLFPIMIWAFLYRRYFHEPSQIPRNLEDQRRILRENVAKIKAEKE